MGDPKKIKRWDPVVTPKSNQWFPIEYIKKIITDNNITLKKDIEEKDLKAISKDLKWAAELYDCTENISKGPSRPEIRAALMDFKRKAEKFWQSMEELDYRSKNLLLLQFYPDKENKDIPLFSESERFQMITGIPIHESDYKNYEPPGASEFFETAQNMVKHLADLSKKALTELQAGEPGNPRKAGLNSFINELDKIYKRLTDQDGGLTKSFLGFVDDCLAHIKKPAKNMDSLKQRVNLLREKK